MKSHMFEIQYLKLEKDARLVDPISSYMFIFVSEIFIINAKNNPEIQGINIFKDEIFYNAYTDDIKDKIL